MLSFFKGIPATEIAQLYFSPEAPSQTGYHKYYQISDKQVLKSLLKRKHAGGKLTFSPHEHKQTTEQNPPVKKIRSIRRSHFFRLTREFLWKSQKWQSQELVDWVQDFSPDVIFFCAGDAEFAYEITDFVLNITDAKLVTYLTDDYVLPRQKASFIWQIRQKRIRKKMDHTIAKSQLLLTISEEMRVAYREIFGKDSLVALNMSESMKIELPESTKQEDEALQLIYAGGIYLQRHEVLQKLIEALGHYNQVTSGPKAFLKIYSAFRPNQKVLEALTLEGTSAFLGELTTEELRYELSQADIPVHVESFDEKAIEVTRLSISTKIPEYLSLGKAILAIGPEQVASMKYLEETAYCITEPSKLKSAVSHFLSEESLRSCLGRSASLTYQKNHDAAIIRKNLQEQIYQLVESSGD